MDLVIRRHTGLFAALGLALAGRILPSGSQAWTGFQAEASTDTVRGMVFDSLSRGPLAGASVIADPGGESVITDDRGPFQLISTMPVRRPSVFHGFLD